MVNMFLCVKVFAHTVQIFVCVVFVVFGSCLYGVSELLKKATQNACCVREKRRKSSHSELFYAKFRLNVHWG